MSALMLLIAIALAIWAALTSTDYVTYGTYGFLLALSLAFGWASMFPWPPRSP